VRRWRLGTWLALAAAALIAGDAIYMGANEAACGGGTAGSLVWILPVLGGLVALGALVAFAAARGLGAGRRVAGIVTSLALAFAALLTLVVAPLWGSVSCPSFYN